MNNVLANPWTYQTARNRSFKKPPRPLARIVHLLLLFVPLVTAPNLHAEEPQRLGLVLAGGGASGLAHVGVIKELEKLGLRPDCIVGTSMGAIVGGLYASGYTAAEIEDVVLNIDWSTILNDYSDRSLLHPMRRDSRVDPFSVAASLPLGIDEEGVRVVPGAIDGIKLSLLLRDLTSTVKGVRNFDRLPIPFRAVATDLETGQEVILRRGDLATALRASMSIPALLPAVERNGKILVDGGISNNFPTDVARAMCGDVLIGVNLPDATPDRRQLTSVTGTVTQLMALMVSRQEKINQASLTEGDVVLLPNTQDIKLLDFHRATDAIELGSQAVLASMNRLEKIIASRSAAHQQQQAVATTVAENHRVDRTLSYDAVRIENPTRLDDRIISSRLGLSESGWIDVDTFGTELVKIYGLGLFGSVSYRLDDLDGSEDQSELVVSVDNPTHGNTSFRVGLTLEDDFQADADYTLGAGVSFTHLNDLAARVDIDVLTGSTLGFQANFEQPLDFRQTRFVETTASFLKSTVPVYENGQGRVADFTVSEGRLGSTLIWAPSSRFRIGGGVSYRWNRVQRRTAGLEILQLTGLDEDWDGGARVGLALDYDSLDSSDLPHHGSQISIRFDVDIEDKEENVGEVSVDAITARTFGSYTLSGFLSLDGELEPEGIDPHFLGGFQRLSGLAQDELFGNIAIVSGVRAYRNFALNQLFGLEAFIGGSLEYGGVWDEWRDIDSANALFHGSIFGGAETTFGPVLLGLGLGEENAWAARFSIGYRF